eukprot:gb/GECG01011651.1/.p1 GENE.gb/GECG01011651.1/~~gb/GECG01011651.1/.p1  ORF type:complete len:183 (+),score=36.76 gb/GECG01011651.1/:1-549(+)
MAEAQEGGSAAGNATGMEDLLNSIDTNSTYALNVKQENEWKGILRGGGACLTSDADDQLIVYIPFRSPVRLRAIKVEAPEGKPRPAAMKVFVNKPTVGFEEVEDEPATQSFDLHDANLTREGKSLETRFTKFQQVTSLHLFFDNPDEDNINVSRLQFLGKSIDGVNVSQLKEVGKEMKAAEG